MNKLRKLLTILGQEVNYIVVPTVLTISSLFGAGRLGNRIRVFLLRLSGINIGQNTMIRPGINFSGDNAKLTIGHKTSINYNALIDLMDTITIGHVCQIGPHVSFITSSHVLQSDFKHRRADVSAGPIVIEDYVWIGANTTILGNVTVGKGSIIAAGSLVNKNVPSNCVVAGIPAKIIKHL